MDSKGTAFASLLATQGSQHRGPRPSPCDALSVLFENQGCVPSTCVALLRSTISSLTQLPLPAHIHAIHTPRTHTHTHTHTYLKPRSNQLPTLPAHSIVTPGVPIMAERVLDDALHFMNVELETLGVEEGAVREAALARVREGVRDRTIARMHESEAARCVP